jgi:hypothetical protein
MILELEVICDIMWRSVIGRSIGVGFDDNGLLRKECEEITSATHPHSNTAA